jgi:multidrug resistance efflux pump
MLERALVASGDVVSQGQTLARMDGREVRCELATLYADRAAATKKRDAAMAAHDAAEMQMARLDIERLDLQINVLERRAEHLEIKAAIGGIVILGDLERAEGAPLTVGQNLFEIAPLDKMVVELAVPEDDVAYVGPQSQVRFRLDAYPGRRWEGAVEKIHPRAEQQEGRQVFVAEFDLDNGDQRLKPGMSGRARITSRLRPLFWVLFHKAWERAVIFLGW